MDSKGYGFEDLEVYKLTREFRRKIYQLARELPKQEQYGLAGQMRRAAVSLTNGIAEGHGRYHYQENIQFVRYSRGSLNELIDDLNACLDENYAEHKKLDSLKDEGYFLMKKLNGYLKYLKNRKESSITND